VITSRLHGRVVRVELIAPRSPKSFSIKERPFYFPPFFPALINSITTEMKKPIEASRVM
jgi:hypothetical protein